MLISDSISKRELQLIDKGYLRLVSDTEVYYALFSLGFVQYLFENGRHKTNRKGNTFHILFHKFVLNYFLHCHFFQIECDSPSKQRNQSLDIKFHYIHYVFKKCTWVCSAWYTCQELLLTCIISMHIMITIVISLQGSPWRGDNLITKWVNK